MMAKAVILAGGLSRRMGGGNKCLKELGGATVLQHVIDRLTPQTFDLALNCNDDPSLFIDYNLSVLPDVVPDFVGPLAGVLTAMEWMQRNWPDDTWVMTVPGDTPFLPRALGAALAGGVARNDDADLIAPEADGRIHFLCGLWNLKQADNLRKALVKENVRAVKDWVKRLQVDSVKCALGPGESFSGLNTPAELEAAQKKLRQAQ